MATFEQIFNSINSFGKFQYQNIFYICLGSLIAPIATYINIFIAAKPNHICKTYHLNKSLSQVNLINNPNTCSVIVNGTEFQCSSWKFDKRHYELTLTEEWGLVCQNSFLRANIQTIFFTGVLIGSIVLGKLSDSYGRRPAILIGIILMAIGSLGTIVGVQKAFGFYINYIAYVLSGFLIAFGTRGLDEAGYVLALELVGPTKKAISGIMIESFFAIGHIILVVAAYFLRDWRSLSIFLFIFILPFLFFYKLIPESPRWLISQNRKDDAYKILIKVASRNEKQFDKESWHRFCADEKIDQEPIETFMKLIKYPYFTFVFIALVGMWIVINLTFYGIGIKTNDLGVDPYLSFLLAGVLELIACIFTFFVINKLSRKVMFTITSIVVTVCSFAIVFIENIEISLVLAMIAKFTTTVSFSVLRVYSNEIFPTTIRVSCIGACSTISRLGVVLSPVINALGDKYWKPLLFFVIAILGCLSMIISFFIPETVGRIPAENLQEFDQLFAKKKSNRVVLCDIHDTEEFIITKV